MRKLFLLMLLCSVTTFAQSDKVIDKAAKTADKAINTTSKGLGTAYSDLKEGVSTIHGDVKDAVKYLTPEAKKLLIKTAEKLEKTTDEVWHILVRQQRVWALCYLALFISAMIFWYKFSVQYKLSETDLKETGEQKDSHQVMSIIYLVLALIFSGFSSYHFADMMTGFFNPEYGAMKNLYEVYKSLR